MSALDELADELKRLKDRIRKLEGPQFIMGEVDTVDTGAETASMKVNGSEVKVQVDAHAGFLPAVGDKIFMPMKGRIPIAISARQLVNGDMQSKGYVPDVSGWLMNSDGDLFANSARLRGTLSASAIIALAGPNLVPNPGAEVNTTGWTGVTGTLSRDTVTFHDGVGSFKLHNGTGSTHDLQMQTDYLTVDPTFAYVVSFLGLVAVFGRALQVQIDWYTGASAHISADNRSVRCDTLWTQTLPLIVVPPSNAAKAKVSCFVLGSPNGEDTYFDRVLFGTAALLSGGAVMGSHLATRMSGERLEIFQPDDDGDLRGRVRWETERAEQLFAGQISAWTDNIGAGDYGVLYVENLAYDGTGGTNVLGHIVLFPDGSGDFLDISNEEGALLGPWTDATPSFNNLNLGAGGVAVVKYNRIGKTAIVRFDITFGTSPSATGEVSMALPWNAANDGTRQTGTVVYHDVKQQGALVMNANSPLVFFYSQGQTFDGTHPYGFGPIAGYHISGQIVYQIA